MSSLPFDQDNFPEASIKGLKIPHGGFWLFAYGSLMWDADFRYTERKRAVLTGYHRSLCVYSWRYRGTIEKPGLVFGLDRGGMTQGVAYRIGARFARRTFEELFRREMPTKVYRPTWLPVRLLDGRIRRATALAFVADNAHPQYTGRLTDMQATELIRQGHGMNGPCCDYITNTIDALRREGIRDLKLERIAGKLD